jgi:hypothetical protein
MQLSSNNVAGSRAARGAAWETGNANSRGQGDLLEQVHQLQNTFTAVLASFGREGFASAEATSPTATTGGAASPDSSMEDAISHSWNQWFDQRGAAAYKNVSPGADAPDLKQEYGQILLEAYRSGGYATPTAFLQSLSKEQLSTIQTIHRLANPIDVSQLQDEGATNLLLPPAAQVDFDHDGLTQVGLARTIRFPDSSTPADVRDAWEEATADLTQFQKMLYEFQMKLPTLTANLRVDASGSVRAVQPGEPDWVNPMASPAYSYQESINQRLDYLDTFKNQIPSDQYQRDHRFWTKFKDLLSA